MTWRYCTGAWPAPEPLLLMRRVSRAWGGIAGGTETTARTDRLGRAYGYPVPAAVAGLLNRTYWALVGRGIDPAPIPLAPLDGGPWRGPDLDTWIGRMI